MSGSDPAGGNDPAGGDDPPADPAGVRVGVDIGGTFTDVVSITADGVTVTKTPTTPDAPEEGVLDGLETSRERADFEPGDVTFLSHGTTVATNAVLEGTWADTALVTTEGFRDALEIGRQARPDIYDFRAEKADPIVPRNRRFEVPERLDERGHVRRELDEEAVRALADRIADSGAESVAISLLFAFENDDHERRVADLLREEGLETSLSLSSVVLPEIREYERTLTTALNAGLKPVMDAYIGGLETRIADRGVPADLRLMQSNGGLITSESARERPVNTLLSGPAGGVQGAAYVAGRCGFEDIVTMDMGGTSCDVSLVEGGDPLVSTDVEVGDYRVGVPMIDIHTVGAGGGSTAWVDAGDALRVGPRSAGADPGPICYGRGGTEPTTTDAHLLLGRIEPDRFLPDEGEAGGRGGSGSGGGGGAGADRVPGGVDVADVRDAVATRLGEPLGMEPEAVAQGILDVANANMERALRVVSVERGYDPRDFALVAFGGAGPLHACRLAADLDIPRVLVPRAAGVLSALGLLITDVIYDDSVSRVRAWDEVTPATLQEVFDDLHERGDVKLADAGFEPDRRAFERVADLRYVGQSFDVPVPVPDGDVDDGTLATLEERFHERHERRYGHADPDEPVELVTLRLRARGLVETPDLPAAPAEGDVDEAIRETREVTFGGEPLATRIYDRDHLPAGGDFEGPAVVEGSESTVVVHPGQTVEIDDEGNLLVDTGGGR